MRCTLISQASAVLQPPLNITSLPPPVMITVAMSGLAAFARPYWAGMSPLISVVPATA